MAGITLPSDLELQALSVVYAEGSCTVATVLNEMPDQRERAYTTILSVMQSLERKGLVKTKREGRAYVYLPTRSQNSIVAPLAKEFVQNAFGGSVGRAILLLLSAGNLTPEEKSAVECELKKHKAMAAKKKTTKRKAAKRKPAKKVVKRKVAKKAAKRKPAKKAAKKKVAKRKPAKKAAKKKAAKKAKKKVAKKKAAKKPAKKAAKKKAAKKAKKKVAKKKVAKKKVAKKKAAKKAAKKKVARKRK